MKLSEQEMENLYRSMDLDPAGVLQQKTFQQICAKKTSFKRKTVWGLSFACAAACVWLLIGVWQNAKDVSYLPDPAEFNRMNFAFYRDLALPGQDLGISLEDFPS